MEFYSFLKSVFIVYLQESYAMLIKHELPVAKEETERCDTLRYSWEKLNVQAAEVQTHLLAIQPDFKSNLIENVKEFIEDCDGFYKQYDTVCTICFQKCFSIN